MKIRIRLTKEEMNKITSFDVLNKIFQYNFKFDKDLNHSQLALHNIFIIEGDIENGGFIQFLQNNREKFFKSGLAALKLIEDMKTYKIFVEAINIYYRNEPFLSAENLQALLDKSDENRLEELDNSFYEASSERQEKLEKYIKKNIYDFVDSRSDNGDERVKE